MRLFAIRPFGLILLLAPANLGFFQLYAPVAAQARHDLRPGESAEADLAAGGAVQWEFGLKEGDFCLIEVSQPSLDLVVHLSGPGGASISTLDLTGPPDPETVMVIAEGDGIWILEVRALDPEVEGAFRLTWRASRPATRQDRLATESQNRWLRAVERSAEGDSESAAGLMERSIGLLEEAAGESLELQGRLDSLTSALLANGDFEKAEATARRSSNLLLRLAPEEWLKLARVQQSLAMALQGQQRIDEAIGSMRDSVVSLEKLPAPPPELLAEAYGSLGGLHYQRAAYQEARDALAAAAEILQGREEPADPLFAMVLNNLGAVEETLEAFESAEATYRKALEIRERIFGPDHEEVAVTLNNLAFLQERVGRYEEAQSLLERSARILRERLGPEDPQFALATNNLASIYRTQGRFEDAERAYRMVERIFRKAYGEKHQETAGVLGNLGILLMSEGRYSEAEPNFKSALAILREALGDHPLTANALNNLGELYRSQGRWEEAETLYRQSISMYENAFGEKALQTMDPRNNMATLWVDAGRFAEAEAAFSQLARGIESGLGANHPSLAIAFNNLANVYLEQGRFEDAEAFLKRAKTIWVSNYGEVHPNVGVASHNLARLYFEAGRLDEAEPLLDEALRIRLQTLDKGHPDIPNSLTLRADLHLRRHDLPAALEDYRDALRRTRKALGDEHPRTAVAVGKLGRALVAANRLEEARPLLENAVRTLSERGSYPEGLIRDYSALARLVRRSGDRPRAISLLATALEEAERLRPRVGGGEETRAKFLQRVAGEFDLMVRWQLEAGNPEAAFEYAERSRARALLDQLSVSGVDLRRSLPQNVREELLGREARARAEVAEFQQRIRVLRARDDLDPALRGERIKQLTASLRAADREYQRVYEELKSNSPLWTGLITDGGDTASLETVRRSLIREGSALMLYQIGSEDSHLFVVFHDSGLEVHPLRLGPEADAAGIEPGPLTDEKLVRLLGGDGSNRMGSTAGLAMFPRLSELLARALVPLGIRSRLRRLEEVVVVPHGLLNFLPLEMLVMSGARGPDPVYWLDSGPAVRYASSATTLLNLQRRSGPATWDVLSLSDPVFQNAGSGSGLDEEGALEGPVQVGATRGMMGPLVDLPGSARETERIRRAFPQAKVLQKEQATESNLRHAIGGSAYIHLATHGLVDETRRSLFSALALSRPSDMRGGSLDDGLLQLYEIYDLDLTQAELAVLSACQTNVGSRVGGDGVFALSRGFLAAGARRVIATQWRVDDESSSELIGDFFDGLAEAHKTGSPVDYAGLLRAAKLKIRNQTRWSSPHHWAPFILVGAR